MAALCGKKYCPEKPIREGQSKARVEVDMGEFVVTRTFTKHGGGSLTVIAADGTKLTSPQTFLDTIVGKISFDPLAFVNEKDQKKQRQTILDLLGISFDDINANIAAMRENRTVVGRERDRLKAAAESITVPEPLNLPDKEVSITELSANLQEANSHNHALKERRSDLVRLNTELTDGIECADDLQKRIDELQKRLDDQSVNNERHIKAITTETAALDLAADIDTAPIMEQLEKAEEINHAIREVEQKEGLEAEFATATGKYKKLTADIESLETDKTTMLTEAKMPIPGLTVTDDGVEYNGIPISQASQGERLRVGVAVGIALNPTLRVMRITEGSVLDSDNIKAIADMVEEKDFQIWLEVVDETGTIGVYIEDGEIVTDKAFDEGE